MTALAQSALSVASDSTQLSRTLLKLITLPDTIIAQKPKIPPFLIPRLDLAVILLTGRVNYSAD